MEGYNLPVTAWRKSSYSADQGACVEVMQKSGTTIAIRDSTNAEGARLVFTVAQWESFTRQLKGSTYNV